MWQTKIFVVEKIFPVDEQCFLSWLYTECNQRIEIAKANSNLHRHTTADVVPYPDWTGNRNEHGMPVGRQIVDITSFGSARREYMAVPVHPASPLNLLSLREQEQVERCATLICRSSPCSFEQAVNLLAACMEEGAHIDQIFDLLQRGVPVSYLYEMCRAYVQEHKPTKSLAEIESDLKWEKLLAEHAGDTQERQFYMQLTKSREEMLEAVGIPEQELGVVTEAQEQEELRQIFWNG